MRDIEDQLRGLGERMRHWEVADNSLPASTFRRVQQRRRSLTLLGSGAVSMVAVVSALGVAHLTQDGPKASDREAQIGASGGLDVLTPSPEPRGSQVAIPRDDYFGSIWPEDSRQETSEGCSSAGATPGSFRKDAMSTALEFGAEVLGWPNAEGVARGEVRNSVQVELSRDVSGQSAVDLSMVEYARDCWSVQTMNSVLPPFARMPVMWDRQVEGSGNDQTNVISIGFDAPDGTAGHIELGYGVHNERRWFTAGEISMSEPIAFTLGALDPYDAGHAFILFEDEQGRVTTGFGVPLNPQKGFARSDGLP